MDFAESKAGAAREIALAFGVPPLLLGLPGDATFSNYSEANRAFWRQTVLPLVARVQKSFQAWLRPGYGDFRLDYNADRLEALATERAAEWERVGKADFLTLDERREAVGYGPAPKDALFGKDGVDLERRYSPSQPRVPAGSPEGGQWAPGGSRKPANGGGEIPIGGNEAVAMNVDRVMDEGLNGSVELAQSRGGGRGRGVANEPGAAAASQLDRFEMSRDLAREAETRVREIDPLWKPEPTLSDPNDIESRIARNEDLTRQANERYAGHLREKYGDSAAPNADRPLRNLTGPRAQGSGRDDAATNRGRARENDTADIVWLNRHNVEQLAQRSNARGVKQPDFRIDGEIFGAFAPAGKRARNVWSYAEDKIAEGQAENILINLMDTPLTVEEIVAQFRAYPIPGLKRLWVVDQRGKLHYLF